uniref:Uncharacterized protein n=1 Tax=Anser cygnoides TaxID=8845 RepID=A0A8B9IJR9_ANSCY
ALSDPVHLKPKNSSTHITTQSVFTSQPKIPPRGYLSLFCPLAWKPACTMKWGHSALEGFFSMFFMGV